METSLPEKHAYVVNKDKGKNWRQIGKKEFMKESIPNLPPSSN
jgi:hypothetical protein